MSIASITHWHCQKVLPLTYDDSLSYYEMVCKLINKINELTEVMNEWEILAQELQEGLNAINGMKEDIIKLQEEDISINAKIAIINGQIDDINEAIRSVNAYYEALEKRVGVNEKDIEYLKQTVNSFNAIVDSKLKVLEATLKRYIDDKVIEYETEVRTLQLKINQIRVNLQGQINDLKERVDAMDTSVLNPWHNRYRIDQDTNAKYVYKDLADAVPTAEEYCMLELTAEEYSKFALKAIDYARFGKKKLHFDWVYSPVYGWKQEINNVLTSIVNNCMHTINATVYAEMGLTADEYNNFNLTALDYYGFAPERIGLYLEEGVLQSEQYILVEQDGVLELFGATTEEADGLYFISE